MDFSLFEFALEFGIFVKKKILHHEYRVNLQHVTNLILTKIDASTKIIVFYKINMIALPLKSQQYLHFLFHNKNIIKFLSSIV